MEYSIITTDNFKTSGWSGGTTTELFIFPPTADYQQRNFQFRLSTATVEADRSDFTLLNGISRKLMVLSGETTLDHEGLYRKLLHKFDMDEFEGGWKTTSHGKCTDFNLMTTGNTTGELMAMVIHKNGQATYHTGENCDWLFIYNYSGKATVDINNKQAILNAGDLLVLNNPAMVILEIKGIENSELVLVKISENIQIV